MNLLCEITCEEPLIKESETLSTSPVIPDGDNWGIWWRKKLNEIFDKYPNTSFKGLSLKITNNETGKAVCTVELYNYDISTIPLTKKNEDDTNLEASQTDH